MNSFLSENNVRTKTSTMEVILRRYPELATLENGEVPLVARASVDGGRGMTGRRRMAIHDTKFLFNMRDAVRKKEEGEGSLGKPTLALPHPMFYDVFSPSSYAPGTLSNKKSHMRGALNFLEFSASSRDMRHMSIFHWRSWGLLMAESGCDW